MSPSNPSLAVDDQEVPAHVCARDDVRAASNSERIARVLRDEPRWLRGLNWRLVGMTAAVMLALSSFAIVGALESDRSGQGGSWECALLVLAANTTAAFLILVIATFLANMPRPRLPLPVVLAIAVLTGSTLGIGAFKYAQALIDDRISGGWISGGRLLDAFMAIRQMVLPWAIAASAWYFAQRADAREYARRATELASHRLEADMLEARLQALQAQVEPHFLFNTLAHIKHLYRTDAQRARLMLDSFRTYLRSALPQIRGHDPTLGRELDLVRAYLDVQKVRMGQRLHLLFNVPQTIRDEPFPSMMLISLVENAIKHGLNPLPEGGVILITGEARDGVLKVSVEDSGHGIGDEIGSGVGLSNIRNRLAAHFGSRAQLSLVPCSPRGVRAEIVVPIAAHRAIVGVPALNPDLTLERTT